MSKFKREAGLVTCKFSADIDLEESNLFIKNWIWYALVCCKRRCPPKIKDRDLIFSSALEACMDAFTYLKLKRKDEKWGLSLIKTCLGISCKRCLFHQLIYFGFLPDKKRIFFPKSWVSWEEYFLHELSPKDSFAKLDLELLHKADIFTETEQIIIKMSLEGFTPKEVSEKTGYGKRWISLVLQRLQGKLADIQEVNFRKKFKYGAIGPYKKLKRINN